jgi:hypothetical protein
MATTTRVSDGDFANPREFRPGSALVSAAGVSVSAIFRTIFETFLEQIKFIFFEFGVHIRTALYQVDTSTQKMRAESPL